MICGQRIVFFWTMINQLQTKKLWWALTPLKWLYAMKSMIDEYFLKVNGSIKLMDLDEISLKKAWLIEKLFTTKVQRVEYDKIRSSVAMLIVYVDYSSNHYIFLLWDMLVGWQNTLLNRSMYTRYNQEFCWSVEY